MLRTLVLTSVALMSAASVWAVQDGKSKGGSPPPAEMPMPQAGAEHKIIQRSFGNWDATCDMMGQTSKGTMEIIAGPGAFTAHTHFKGDMGGMPFEGRGVDGFDSNKKKFVSVWTDNMVTFPIVMEGSWDEKSQTMTMLGDMPDMTGKLVKHKLVTKWTGNDVMDFEIWTPGPDGKDMSTFKIHYTRKK